MLPEPCIILLFVELRLGGYAQMIRTGIILLNGWVITSPRRIPFVSLERSFQFPHSIVLVGGVEIGFQFHRAFEKAGSLTGIGEYFREAW